METCYIGIDNGVSGSIGVVCGTDVRMFSIPTKKELSYTKAVRHITRIDCPSLIKFFQESLWEYTSETVKVFLERPMVNPMRFQATTSAIRALEATLIAVEFMQYPLQYVDSKQWQKALLPSGIKGSEDLKRASMDIGCRLFPKLSQIIIKQGDSDGVLIAEAARRGKW